MIKANELRIGNWVSKNDKIITIDAEGILDIERTGSDTVEPISLNEEWLRKLGFSQRGPNQYIKELPKRNITDSGVFRVSIPESTGQDLVVSIDRRQEKNQEDTGFVELVECQFVHQLQNLYFALSGEEL